MVFDHADAYSFGHEAASLKKPREVPKIHTFADPASEEEFNRSWLQGYDSLNEQAPWEEKS